MSGWHLCHDVHCRTAPEHPCHEPDCRHLGIVVSDGARPIVEPTNAEIIAVIREFGLGRTPQFAREIVRLRAALAREVAEAALWRTNLEHAQSDLAGEVEAHRLEREARVRAEGERDDAERELAGVRVTFTAMEELRMQTRDALVRQNAKVAALEAERDGIDALWLKARFDAVDAHQRIAVLEAALRPFAKFAEAFDAKPIARLDDEFYAIHTGTQWEASLRLSDCRAARAALAPPERP